MKKPIITTLTLSSAVALGSVATQAAENPFAMKVMESGYQQLAMGHKDGEGKCGEGKCGGDKKGEGACGEGKDAEGSCGHKGDKDKEGSCGHKEGKDKEGKCGEGKCGSA